MNKLKICFATSECVPFVKTGGLADVSGALPNALTKQGCEVKVFLPLYGSINAADHNLRFVAALEDIKIKLGPDTRSFNCWYKKNNEGVEFYFIDCPYYFHRGRTYTSDADEDERFYLFQHAVFAILQRLKWSPTIMHCNDWQTSLMPVYLKKNYTDNPLFKNTVSVLSIHNIGYQGRFAKESIIKAGLDPSQYYPTGPFEFFDSFSTLKAGILYADSLTTVSETYAQEIQTPAYGHGLEGGLATRKDDLFGIINGIDPSEWNPENDSLIPGNYNTSTIGQKAENRKALLNQTIMPNDKNIPVIGIITRLAEQKGLELLMSVFNEVIQGDLQFVVLGSGEQKYEDFFRWAQDTYPQKVFSYIGYSNELAHLITAGADLFLMPSLYEPCGLNQMYSLNYGTIPVVRKTGGLADTVIDFDEDPQNGNGFSFEKFEPQHFFDALLRATTTFQDKKTWRKLMLRGMAADFTWERSAKKYIRMYRNML